MVTEGKEMLNATYESTVPQANVYCWYNELKDERKSVELIGRPSAPTTALNKQSTLARP